MIVNLIPVTVFMENKKTLEKLALTFVVLGDDPLDALGKIVLHARDEDQFADMRIIGSSVGSMKQIVGADGFALIDINETK